MTVEIKRRAGDIREYGKLARRAMARAINRAGVGFRTEVARNVGRSMGLSVTDMKAASSIAKVKAKDIEAGATYEARGKRLNLIRFKARKTKRGVSARSWGRRRIYKGTFIANSGRTVFVRQSADRLPIRPVFGPGVAEQVQAYAKQGEVQARIEARIEREFASSFDALLAKAKAPKV